MPEVSQRFLYYFFPLEHTLWNQADTGEGCIGMQLAQIELAVAATFFFREFPNAKISSVMREKDMELEDRFVMNPRGQKCMIIVE